MIRGAWPRAGRARTRDRDIDLGKPRVEALAVLGVFDGLHRGPQHAHAVALERPGSVQRDPAVECGLSAEGKQDSIRPFLRDHLLHEFGS